MLFIKQIGHHISPS